MNESIIPVTPGLLALLSNVENGIIPFKQEIFLLEIVIAGTTYCKEIKAVENVSFSIRRGEVFSLVGESGCGKSTTGRCLIDLISPTSGSIEFDGKNIAGISLFSVFPNFFIYCYSFRFIIYFNHRTHPACSVFYTNFLRIFYYF